MIWYFLWSSFNPIVLYFCSFETSFEFVHIVYFVSYDRPSLLQLIGNLSVASAQELLVVNHFCKIEPCHRIALIPVVDASDTNLPGHDAIDLAFLIIERVQFGQDFID